MAISVEKCQRNGCTGTIVDGICEDCGRPPVGKNVAKPGKPATPANTTTRTTSTTGLTYTGYAGTNGVGSRRSSRQTTISSTARQHMLGGGLVSLPEQPSQDPLKLVMAKPEIPERKRFCPNCNAKVNRNQGYCPNCGKEYNFAPQLMTGEMVNGKYEIKGPIAFGGMGWIYLGWDTLLKRWVVMKGLLNTKDEAATAAAVAERQFLASVKHPKIVSIYDFLQHGLDGFIIMEYVGGRTIQSIRQERGPLPVDEAISYILGILPAFTYLHERGLVYCDFKPENFMLEEDDVKLVDMGGVRQLNDPHGDIFGTRGFMAPEAADNPIEVSDLYTIGRALATLVMEFKYISIYEKSLPLPSEQPVLAENEALYRFLLRATHLDPDQRFQSATEMTDQLFGVLREVVALKSSPKPAESKIFTYDNLIDPEDLRGVQAVEPRLLPSLRLEVNDPAATELATLATITDARKRVDILENIVNTKGHTSPEARRWLADALMMNQTFDEARKLLDALAAEDPFDWKVSWYRGKMYLLTGDAAAARNEFDKVYFVMPGEIAPKLAIGFAAEQNNDLPVAIAFYERVAKTDPNDTTAVFGLSRCLRTTKDLAGARAALELFPKSHSLYLQSRVALANLLLENDTDLDATLLHQADQTIASITIDSSIKHQLAAKLLVRAVDMLAAGKLKADKQQTLLGHMLEDDTLRSGAEIEYRKAARLGGDPLVKIALIDQANVIRPLTRF